MSFEEVRLCVVMLCVMLCDACQTQHLYMLVSLRGE